MKYPSKTIKSKAKAIYYEIDVKEMSKHGYP